MRSTSAFRMNLHESGLKLMKGAFSWVGLVIVQACCNALFIIGANSAKLVI